MRKLVAPKPLSAGNKPRLCETLASASCLNIWLRPGNGWPRPTTMMVRRVELDQPNCPGQVNDPGALGRARRCRFAGRSAVHSRWICSRENRLSRYAKPRVYELQEPELGFRTGRVPRISDHGESPCPQGRRRRRRPNQSQKGFPLVAKKNRGTRRRLPGSA